MSKDIWFAKPAICQYLYESFGGLSDEQENNDFTYQDIFDDLSYEKRLFHYFDTDKETARGALIDHYGVLMEWDKQEKAQNMHDPMGTAIKLLQKELNYYFFKILQAANYSRDEKYYFNGGDTVDDLKGATVPVAADDNINFEF